jgi:hypothetical protein
MQQKHTTVGVALQQYALVRCDIDSLESSLVLLSFTVIRVYLATHVTLEGPVSALLI